MKHVPMQHPSNEDLFAYRDGELTGEKRFLIEAHVVSCASCRELVDGLSDIEADFKRRPDDVGEEYYARMTESVLAKIGVKSAAGAGAKSRERARRPAEDAPLLDRRRPDFEPDAESPRRRHLFPWFGVVGAGAAAAAVTVVVVMLAQRQGEWVRAPRPAGTGAPEEPLAARGDSAMEEPAATAEGKLADEKEKSELLDRGAKDSKRDEIATTLGKQNAVTSEEAGKVAARVTAPTEQKNEPETRSADEALRASDVQAARKSADAGAPAGRFRSTPASAQAPAVGDVAAGFAAGAPPTEEYAAVLRAHGLPPIFDPARVDRDALLKAEGDLRYLYQAGHAETDSARVRLYLAEAARAKVDRADSAAVEGVIHHYWRVIRLSRDDATVAAAARRRLADFLREMGRQP